MMNKNRWALVVILLMAGVLAAADDAKKGPIQQFVIEAKVDGNSELHLLPDGIHWVHNGKVSKPGKLAYVDGKAWSLEWHLPDQGDAQDATKPFPMALDRLNFGIEILAIGAQRGGTTIERRDPVTIKGGIREQVISIPDGQAGARWYTIRVYRKRG